MDLLGPASTVLNSLTQNQQSQDQHTAAQSRTQIMRRQMQIDEMHKTIEDNLNVAKVLLPYDEEASYQTFLKGIAPLGRWVSRENYAPASGLLDQASEAFKKGDVQGGNAFLKAAGPYVVNVKVRERAAQLESMGQQLQAEQMAGDIRTAQGGESHELRAARERANTYTDVMEAVRKSETFTNEEQVLLAKGLEDKMIALTGTNNQEEWTRQHALDQAMIAGAEKEQRAMSRLLYNPDVTKQAGTQIGHLLGSAKEQADMQIYRLLSDPKGRTPEQEQRLGALIASWGEPTLKNNYFRETAEKTLIKLTAELEETRGSLTMFDRVIATDKQGVSTVSQVENAQEGLPDAAQPVSDTNALEHGQVIGIVKMKREVYEGETKKVAAQLAKDSVDQKARAAALARHNGAMLKPNEETLRQIKDLNAQSEASLALSRLLGEENPLALADRKASIPLIEDGGVQVEEEKRLAQLESQRKKDLQTVADERERLIRKERILNARLPEAQKNEEKDRRMNMATQSAYELVTTKGATVTQAVGQVLRYANTGDGPSIDGSELTKRLNTMIAGGLPQAELEIGLRVEAWHRLHPGQKLDEATANAFLNDAQAKYKVDRKDLQKVLESPNKPLVEVSMSDKASEAAAKDFMKSTQTTYDQLKTAPVVLRNLEQAKALVGQAKGFMGPGGESLLEAAKFLNARLGARINVEGIKSAEELRTRIFFNIMDNLKKMDAQPSELQQRIMMDSLGKLGTDPNAMINVLNAYEDLIRDRVETFNREVAGAQKQGTRFPYDPTIVLPDRRGPGGEPVVHSEKDYNALPSGTVFIDPFGKKRQKP